MDQSVNHAFRLVILALEDMQKRLAILEKKAALAQKFLEQHDSLQSGSDAVSESDNASSGSTEEGA